MMWSWSTPVVSKVATRSVPGQYVGPPGAPGAGQVCTEPPGSAGGVAGGTTCAIGRSAAVGFTVQVPPALSIRGKPVWVRKPPGLPPGSDVLKRLLTVLAPLRVRSAIAFSLLRIEWQSAVHPPPCCTNVSSCAYVLVPRSVGSDSEYE